MELNFSNIALIIAAAQAFLLVLLIVPKHKSVFANKFLSLLMLSYTITLLNLFFEDNGILHSFPLLYLLTGVPLTSFPLHYLYSVYLVNRKESFNFRNLIHFLLFFIFEIILIIYFSLQFLSPDGSILHYPNPQNLIVRLFTISVLIQGLIYPILVIRLLKAYNSKLKSIFSSISQVHLNWLKKISYSGIIAVIIFFTEYILMTLSVNLSGYIISSVSFAIYVYGLGYTGLVKSEIFNPNTAKSENKEILSVIKQDSSIKYEKSGLSDSDRQKILSDLLSLMEKEKPFLRSSLTIRDIAEMLSVSQHNLSEVLNTMLQKNFYRFINEYRITKVKEDLLNPELRNIKLLSIAFDAGFNSKASFNTVFKEYTGVTPSEFQKQNS